MNGGTVVYVDIPYTSQCRSSRDMFQKELYRICGRRCDGVLVSAAVAGGQCGRQSTNQTTHTTINRISGRARRYISNTADRVSDKSTDAHAFRTHRETESPKRSQFRQPRRSPPRGPGSNVPPGHNHADTDNPGAFAVVVAGTTAGIARQRTTSGSRGR